MSLDREQIRRDAAEHFRRSPRLAADWLNSRMARACLALLAELEQAERERDELDKLVEALREISLFQRSPHFVSPSHEAKIASAALAAWESE